MLGDVNKLFVSKVDNAQQCFAFAPQAHCPTNNLNFHWRWSQGEGDGIKCRLPFKIFSTLRTMYTCTHCVLRGYCKSVDFQWRFDRIFLDNSVQRWNCFDPTLIISLKANRMHEILPNFLIYCICFNSIFCESSFFHSFFISLIKIFIIWIFLVASI